MKKIVRYVLIAILASLVLYGEYQIFIKGPEYAKPHSGTVINSYASHGRYYSEQFALVRFDNGDIQEVNTGHQEYKIGSRFTYSLNWNPILGACGFAYGWNPGDWYMFACMPGSLFNILLVLALIIGPFIYAFS